MEVIDINSRKSGIAGKLSNLTDRFFFFNEIPCRALEGPIQAFKCPNPVVQREICMMSGREAQKKGQEFNDVWKSSQILYLQGRKIPRDSREYQKILDILYAAVFRLADYQEDLLSTGSAELIHSIGKDDPRDTVLTVQEFCPRLMNERARIRKFRGILSSQEINDAAKKMELDGIEAFHAVREMYGAQVAKLLLASHIRQGEKKNQSRVPKEALEKILDGLVIQQLDELL